MFCNRITVFLILNVWLGLAVLIQAEISVNLTLNQPANSHVFKGDQIKLRCESSQSEGEKVDITWHYSNYDTKPPITNSSNVTNVVTWSEGNKTTSVLTVNIGTQQNGVLFIYCTARNRLKNEMKHDYKSFRYIQDSSIPIIAVTVPRNQKVMEGTRRHNLSCEVSSNVQIPELSITWLFGDQIIAEKLVRSAKAGKHNYLLQCLTERDLGNYTCVASTTMFDRVWQTSETMLLTGNFPENSGMRDKPSLILYLVIFLLLLWKATWEIQVGIQHWRNNRENGDCKPGCVMVIKACK